MGQRAHTLWHCCLVALLLVWSGAAPAAAQGAPGQSDTAIDLVGVPSCAAVLPNAAVVSGVLPGGVFNCLVEGVITAAKNTAIQFSIDPSTSGAHGLLLIVRAVGVKKIDMYLIQEGAGAAGLQVTGTKVFDSEGSCEFYIRVKPDDLAAHPGKYTLMLGGSRRAVQYSLFVTTPVAATQLEKVDAGIMGDLLATCCATSDSEFCKRTLPTALAPDHKPHEDLCALGPNYCDIRGRLVQLAIPDVGLDCGGRGLPPSMANLDALRGLDVAFNAIGGSTDNMAALVANLPRLERLFLRYTGIQGYLWCGMVNSTALTLLSVSGNAIGGGIPECFLEDPTLEELYLSLTNVTGALPDVVIPGSRLRVLYANGNDVSGGLTGAIPDSLANAPLTALSLGGNSFIGDLPRLPDSLQLVNVSANLLDGTIQAMPAAIEVFDASFNHLTGTIPSDLSSTTIKELWLEGNQLAGPVPDLPSSLNALSISNNQLIGTIPSLPASLFVLSVWNNILEGLLPPLPPGSRLQAVSASGNKLQGAIPDSWVGDTSPIEYMDLHNNSLTWPVGDSAHPGGRRMAQASDNPTWTLPRVQYIDLSHNPLGGTLPTDMGALTTLRWLDLSHASLQGSLQPLAAVLKEGAADKLLAYLDVSSNQLTGPIPDELADAPMLSLQPNSALGALEDAVQGRKLGRTLNLADNAFVGTFPQWLLTRPSELPAECNCPVNITLGGPNMRLSCPDLGAMGQEVLDAIGEQGYECWAPSGDNVLMVEDGKAAVSSSGSSETWASARSRRQLTKAQIAGIVVGSVGAAALVAVLLMVGLRWRKRQGAGYVREGGLRRNGKGGSPLDVEAAFGLMPDPTHPGAYVSGTKSGSDNSSAGLRPGTPPRANGAAKGLPRPPPLPLPAEGFQPLKVVPPGLLPPNM